MSQPLALSAAMVTMTSREIADLVESRHDDVKRSIERLAERGVITLPPMAEVSNAGLGPKTVAVFQVGKRDSYIIVAQLSPEFTARLVDRWQELEARSTSALPDFSNPVIAARAWADAKEGEQVALMQLEQARPAVEFVERYVQAEGLKGFREVCKLLKANEARFRHFVLSSRIMYRLAGALTAYQNHIDAGRFEVRTGVAESDHAYSTTKFTPKGVDWIAGEWGKYQLADGGAGR